MIYLSRRVREIREEEKHPKDPWVDFIRNEWVYHNRRVPIELDPVDWRGRAG